MSEMMGGKAEWQKFAANGDYPEALACINREIELIDEGKKRLLDAKRALSQKEPKAEA